MSGCNISHRKIGLCLDPFAIILPQVGSRHKLSSQHNDDDDAQQELEQTPKPNLDFRIRVRFLRSNLLPSSEPFVSLAFTCCPFLVFLLLFMPVLLVSVSQQRKVRITAVRRGNLIGTRGNLNGDGGRGGIEKNKGGSTHTKNGRFALQAVGLGHDKTPRIIIEAFDHSIWDSRVESLLTFCWIPSRRDSLGLAPRNRLRPLSWQHPLGVRTKTLWSRTNPVDGVCVPV